MAGIRLLQREGVDVIYPKDQSCCGQPAYNSGFPDEARAVALAQVEAFSGSDDPIVVPSGSCAGMMRLHYPHLFKNRPEYFTVKHFSERIFELTAFLVHALNVQYEDKGAPITLTWHSSCHAQREMGCTKESKTLLKQLKNVTLIELENEHECCGFGGTFSIKRPEISAAMVRDKARDIQATGASAFISGDCGCMMNISGHLQKERAPVTGHHIAQFILERIQ